MDPRPAITALAELLLTSPEPVTVAAIGPLTNLALLLRVYPDAAARIGRLVVMGGSAARGGNVTAAAEFNAWADPEAAHAVLTSTLPTVLVGLDVTLPTVLTPDGHRPLRRGRADRRAGRRDPAAVPRFRPQRLRHPRGGRPRRAGADRGDRARHAGHGPPGRRRRHHARRGAGQTLVDRRSVSALPTAVDVAETVDSAAAVEFLVTRLASLDA